MNLAALILGNLMMTITAGESAASPAGAAELVAFDSGRWRWHAVEAVVEPHLGRQSLRLRGGVALVADANLSHGMLEFDMAFGRDRGFFGGIWRVQDERNYEEFYIRPHQAGNPDANQYSPVFNGLSGWQLYHGSRYSTTTDYRFDEWVRVRILFAGRRAEIYVGDMTKPLLFVDDLRRETTSGAVGLSAGNFAPAHFSNVSFVATDAPPIRSRPLPPLTPPANAFTHWEVSDSFPESAVQSDNELDSTLLAQRRWTSLAVEPSGVANLARVQGINSASNTAFARLRLQCDHAQLRRLDFGFSDRVRVYLNGRLLFRGDDSYRSRDYRFLGSIGFFDSLYLPLAAGANELLFAVSEDVGGWGIQAQLDNSMGIIVNQNDHPSK